MFKNYAILRNILGTSAGVRKIHTKLKKLPMEMKEKEQARLRCNLEDYEWARENNQPYMQLEISTEIRQNCYAVMQI